MAISTVLRIGLIGAAVVLCTATTVPERHVPKVQVPKPPKPELTKPAPPEAAIPARPKAQARHPIAVSDIPPPAVECERAKEPKAEAACPSAPRQGPEPEKPPR